ncbi:MAG: RnfABCDGE type electron transport complex subunit G [Bacteroidaceae bacterium]|nr:RnfABCDGE type electron transport complex subunit G [Bacteroidaceae bacterium]
MKKLESTLPNMALVLTLIAVVAGLALGYVNSITEEPIRQIKAQQLSDGIKAVLAADELKVEAPDTLESGAVVYRTDKGTAVQATDPNGFGGKLTVLVGFNDEGLIQGYQVLETSETPGLGAKAGEWFQKGQKGNIIGKKMSDYKDGLFVTKDKNDHPDADVDAITASTITSRAFLRCVNAAYAALNTKCEDAQTGASPQVKENEQ